MTCKEWRAAVPKDGVYDCNGRIYTHREADHEYMTLAAKYVGGQIRWQRNSHISRQWAKDGNITYTSPGTRWFHTHSLTNASGFSNVRAQSGVRSSPLLTSCCLGGRRQESWSLRRSRAAPLAVGAALLLLLERRDEVHDVPGVVRGDDPFDLLDELRHLVGVGEVEGVEGGRSRCALSFARNCSLRYAIALAFASAPGAQPGKTFLKDASSQFASKRSFLVKTTTIGVCANCALFAHFSKSSNDSSIRIFDGSSYSTCWYSESPAVHTSAFASERAWSHLRRSLRWPPTSIICQSSWQSDGCPTLDHLRGDRQVLHHAPSTLSANSTDLTPTVSVRARRSRRPRLVRRRAEPRRVLEEVRRLVGHPLGRRREVGEPRLLERPRRPQLRHRRRQLGRHALLDVGGLHRRRLVGAPPAGRPARGTLTSCFALVACSAAATPCTARATPSGRRAKDLLEDRRLARLARAEEQDLREGWRPGLVVGHNCSCLGVRALSGTCVAVRVHVTRRAGCRLSSASRKSSGNKFDPREGRAGVLFSFPFESTQSCRRRSRRTARAAAGRTW